MRCPVAARRFEPSVAAVLHVVVASNVLAFDHVAASFLENAAGEAGLALKRAERHFVRTLVPFPLVLVDSDVTVVALVERKHYAVALEYSYEDLGRDLVAVLGREKGLPGSVETGDERISIARLRSSLSSHMAMAPAEPGPWCECLVASLPTFTTGPIKQLMYRNERLMTRTGDAKSNAKRVLSSVVHRSIRL